ncbi:hypothetical protein [Tepidiforma sp.]|uniref:hypothetical protein n=1 Tax=Tepidiforma sp. TaxID=2682230 RepID=UPI0026059D1E|nr:hypothetical protein [Tepidiforma sp.]MCX7618927.1 hypothetical protein [Tepidiforma sp.]
MSINLGATGSGAGIYVSGPLFERSSEAIREACAEGLAQLADTGVEVMQDQMRRYQLVRTGRTASSVRAIHRQSRPGSLGYWLITPTDVWAGELRIRQTGTVVKVNKKGIKRRVKTWSVGVARAEATGRPTRSWLAYGERRGRKLRKATNYYAATTAALRKLRYDRVFLPLLSEALQ